MESIKDRLDRRMESIKNLDESPDIEVAGVDVKFMEIYAEIERLRAEIDELKANLLEKTTKN